jgi:hypothetical protein
MRRSLGVLAYAAFMGAVFWGLARWGVLERIGTGWTVVAALVAVGMGVLLAVGERPEDV